MFLDGKTEENLHANDSDKGDGKNENTYFDTSLHLIDIISAWFFVKYLTTQDINREILR